MASAILSQSNENSPDFSSLNERVNRLAAAVDFWNSWMLIGLGIAAVAALWLAISTRLTIVRQKELALAQGELDSAKERQLQGELSAASTLASKADLRRVELQNRMIDIFGPRQLTAEQSTRIAGKLVGLRGVKIDVYVLALDNPYSAGDSKDSEGIGRTVVRTLRDAPAFMDAEGWLLEDCHGSGASNVVVSVRLPSSDADRKIATRVLKALQPEIGTDPEISDESPFCTKFANLDKSGPSKREHDAAITITIGRKISPLLSREMLESTVAEKP